MSVLFIYKKGKELVTRKLSNVIGIEKEDHKVTFRFAVKKPALAASVRYSNVVSLEVY